MSMSQEERIARLNGTYNARPTSDSSYEEISNYYNQSRADLDADGMYYANQLANQKRTAEKLPTQDASDDISAMRLLTEGVNEAAPNAGSWIGRVTDTNKYLANHMENYNNGAYDNTNIAGLGNYVKGLATNQGLYDENGNENDLYNEHIPGNSKNRNSSYGGKNDNSLWNAYLDRYKQESDRAARNTIGEVSANTGGLASSYATTAANQAANYYTQQANDAYLNIYQQQYQEYLNQIEQQNYQSEQAYNQYYNQQQLALSQQQSQWEQNYNQANTSWEQQYNEAQLAAQYGDYSKLKALGINTSAYEAAQKASYSSGSSGSSYRGSGSSNSRSASGSKSSGSTSADAALSRANANNGKVTSSADWAALVAAYGEDVLTSNGYYFATSSNSSSKGSSSEMPDNLKAAWGIK